MFTRLIVSRVGVNSQGTFNCHDWSVDRGKGAGAPGGVGAGWPTTDRGKGAWKGGCRSGADTSNYRWSFRCSVDGINVA